MMTATSLVATSHFGASAQRRSYSTAPTHHQEEQQHTVRVAVLIFFAECVSMLFLPPPPLLPLLSTCPCVCVCVCLGRKRERERETLLHTLFYFNDIARPELRPAGQSSSRLPSSCTAALSVCRVVSCRGEQWAPCSSCTLSSSLHSSPTVCSTTKAKN